MSNNYPGTNKRLIKPSSHWLVPEEPAQEGRQTGGRPSLGHAFKQAEDITQTQSSSLV